MRAFIASLQTETNTFSPFPTGLRGFEEMGLHYGDGSSKAGDLPAMIAATLRSLLEQAGHDAVESVFTMAQPGGRTLDGVYQMLRDRILSDLAAAGPVDFVALWLHGAMVAFGCEDCEGDILGRVRALVGPDVPVGSVLDPHCHMTAEMVAAADVLVCMKEYPHTDGPARAAEMIRMLEAMAGGGPRPAPALVDAGMIGFYPTTGEPMAGFVRAMHAAEREPGVVSVSLAHGFPWADVADVGTRVLVYADGQGVALRTAERLAGELQALRERLRVRHLPVDEALDEAAGADGLTVIADAADNAGGGAPADNTAVLARLIERRVEHAALGVLYDPQAVQACFDAGLGASFELRIGGKCGRASGAPVDAAATVLSLTERLDPPGLGAFHPMGRAALVRADGVQVVLCSIRAQTFSPEAFTGAGLDLGGIRCLVVKSSQHFHEAFAPIASKILHVAAGGAMNMRFETLAYTRRARPFWPAADTPATARIV